MDYFGKVDSPNLDRVKHQFKLCDDGTVLIELETNHIEGETWFHVAKIEENSPNRKLAALKYAEEYLKTTYIRNFKRY
jgi:hypothetical protein